MKGLRTCAYKVPDLKAATAWYSKAFNVEPYFVEPYYVGFDICGYELGLQPAGEDHAVGNNVNTLWGTDNIESEYARLISVGATPVEPPRNVGDGILVATVSDPWDNIIGLIYNPHFKPKD